MVQEMVRIYFLFRSRGSGGDLLRTAGRLVTLIIYLGGLSLLSIPSGLVGSSGSFWISVDLGPQGVCIGTFTSGSREMLV